MFLLIDFHDFEEQRWDKRTPGDQEEQRFDYCLSTVSLQMPASLHNSMLNNDSNTISNDRIVQLTGNRPTLVMILQIGNSRPSS